MLWETVALEIDFPDEATAAAWFDTALDTDNEAALAKWDWHALFHDELADGVGDDVPASSPPREVIEWIAAQAAAADGTELLIPPSWKGGVLSLAIETEPAAEVAMVACMLVSSASEAGATSRLLLLGGHDPYNLYGYPDDYTHLLIEQPRNVETRLAFEASDELAVSLYQGQLDAAFAMVAANPLGDEDC